jgi:hypothetical protein
MLENKGQCVRKEELLCHRVKDAVVSQCCYMSAASSGQGPGLITSGRGKGCEYTKEGKPNAGGVTTLSVITSTGRPLPRDP